MEMAQRPGVPRANHEAQPGLPRTKESSLSYNKPEPPPRPNILPAVWDLVISDMTARDGNGKEKYGVRLQPHNGRDALTDAYQEALDLAVYLRQALYERDGR